MNRSGIKKHTRSLIRIRNAIDRHYRAYFSDANWYRPNFY